MSSLSELADQLRTTLDRLCPDELSRHAERLRAKTEPLLNQLASESSRPEMAEAAALVATAPDDLERAAMLFRRAIAAVETVMVRLGMIEATTGVTEPAATWAVPQPPSGSASTIVRGVDPALIAEGLRQGLKISVERVLRIGHDQSGRLVWLEAGDESAGAAHFLRAKRKAEFGGADVAESDIVDLVWQAATRGEVVGVSGTDRLVFETKFRGCTRRVAVTVGSNGFIVGAYPVSLEKRLKPLT